MTSNHSIYSADRLDFVPAGELRVGETLRNLDGDVRIESIEQLDSEERVYNLEIHGEHVFRVASSGVLVHNSSGAEGSFSITQQGWKGYPKGLPKPEGPFRILEGAEYEAARKAANQVNQTIRRADPEAAIGKEIHEIQPVKFGGSPTDPVNKIRLPSNEHRQQVTPWWNKLLRAMQDNSGE